MVRQNIFYFGRVDDKYEISLGALTPISQKTIQQGKQCIFFLIEQKVIYKKDNAFIPRKQQCIFTRLKYRLISYKFLFFKM